MLKLLFSCKNDAFFLMEPSGFSNTLGKKFEEELKKIG